MLIYFFNLPQKSFNEAVPVIELLFRVVAYGRIFSEMRVGAQEQIVLFNLDKALPEKQNEEKLILADECRILLDNKKILKKRIFHVLKQHGESKSERLSLSGFSKGMLLRLVLCLDNAIRKKDKEEHIDQEQEGYDALAHDWCNWRVKKSFLDGLYGSKSPYIEDEEAFGDVAFDTACDALCCWRECVCGDGKECICIRNEKVREAVNMKWGKVWRDVHKMMKDTAMKTLELCCFGKKYLGERRDIADEESKVENLKRKRRSRFLNLFYNTEMIRSIVVVTHINQNQDNDERAMKLLFAIIRTGCNEGRSKVRDMLSGVVSTICELLMRGKYSRDYKYRTWLCFVGDMIQTAITRPCFRFMQKPLYGFFGRISPVFFQADISALRDMLEEEGYGDLLNAISISKYRTQPPLTEVPFLWYELISNFVTLTRSEALSLHNRTVVRGRYANEDFLGQSNSLYFYNRKMKYEVLDPDSSAHSDSSSFSELEMSFDESDSSIFHDWYYYFNTHSETILFNEDEEIRWVQEPDGSWKKKMERVIPFFDCNYSSRFFSHKRKYRAKHKWRRVQTNRMRKRNKGKVLKKMKKEEGFREIGKKRKQRRDDAKYEMRTEMWEHALHELSDEEHPTDPYEFSEEEEEVVV
ncbi:uncharacterized protein MONOS_13666 [Monocercomonoides exilis]|uniref:uncharacterized protein n=1 Tax=Monocercomonoides exilis TaxID=2049356 RepID=UPI0035596339|nr:hypothetical protein MONOS_13666 [Monocercomonoides exilis]|eukprot:MONOS_13666.1-p1 / transcript=MONOS_13666.1 / gene=MONOS_13666 / organism=Monocercomonoides_exilis_PA203 / gene_product=unspecified product / transcript_product=unspecified product / location=Mono_scaffold00861:1037-3081(-) / protein_length=639 / sequence_SO=supercontig / SO=protein_coding / is_pseudo=false